MNRSIPLLLAFALAGCLSADDSTPQPTSLEPTSAPDSSPIHETRDLTGGIDETWFLTIAEPSTETAHATFGVSGPLSAPLSTHQLCLRHVYTSSSGEEKSWSAGTCGQSNLVVSPQVGDDALYERTGSALGPGTHRFHVEGGPQPGQLSIDLEPR